MRRTLSAAALAAFVMLANASAALAAGGSNGCGSHDPGKIGDCAKGIFSSNAKAFWWILLVAGLLFMAASRRAGRAVATGVVLLISGIAIYNPAGIGQMMSNLAGNF
jgi:hypothetical protein